MTTNFYSHSRPRLSKRARPRPSGDRFDIFGDDAELGSGNDMPSTRLPGTGRATVKLA